MSKKTYCDLCNFIIKNDYKKFKAKVKDVKQNSTNKCKWKKIDICMNCYNKLYKSSYSVELNKVKDDVIKEIFNGKGLKPINDILSIGIRTD